VFEPRGSRQRRRLMMTLPCVPYRDGLAASETATSGCGGGLRAPAAAIPRASPSSTARDGLRQIHRDRLDAGQQPGNEVAGSQQQHDQMETQTAAVGVASPKRISLLLLHDVAFILTSGDRR
jgi:hypothetical protein